MSLKSILSCLFVSVPLFLLGGYANGAEEDKTAAKASPDVVVTPKTPDLSSYTSAVKKITDAAMQSDLAYKRLGYMCDMFGPRPNGSEGQKQAIAWCVEEMKKDGFENVRAEEAMVTHWMRGKESATVVSPRPYTLKMAGLGNCVGTPPEGIKAEVLVVKSFDDLKARASEAKGKIVVYNDPFKDYGQARKYRGNGATEAAKVGAVASMTRSASPFTLYNVHTGAMGYQGDVNKIPHAALAPEDADLLQRMQERGEKIVVELKMEAKILPKVLSHNVVADLKGREKPEEIVILSGHIDSWDLSPCAVDDGAGCMAAWEAIRLVKELKLQPRRTMRIVLWTDEENGALGAEAYAVAHKNELAKHILAIETDSGLAVPNGFAFTHASGQPMQNALAISGLIKDLPAGAVKKGFPYSDLGPLYKAGVPCMDFETKMERYFWYHHSEADTVDKVNPEELKRCIAVLSSMSFIAADADVSFTDQSADK